MPKRSLSELFIKSAKPENGQRTDIFDTECKGLVLRLGASGSKAWHVFYRLNDKLHRPVIGHPPAMSLSEARKVARGHREKVLAKLDPFADRTDGKPKTFTALAALYMWKHARPNKRTAAADLRMLQVYVKPTVGKRLVTEITKGDILVVVQGIKDRGAVAQADAVLTLIKSLFNWAVAEDKFDGPSPASTIKRRGKPKVRTRFLSVDELRCFWCAISTLPVEPSVADVLHILVLTGQRASEVIETPRSELKLDGTEPTWTIAAERTKNKTEHRLPLSAEAVAVFRRAIDRSNGHAFVFPGLDGNPLTDGVARRAIHRSLLDGRLKYSALDNGLTAEKLVARFGPHDLRRTFATLLDEELQIREAVISLLLNHTKQGVTGRHYNHSTKLVPMRDAISQWGKFVTALAEPKTVEVPACPI
jgi:integrase